MLTRPTLLAFAFVTLAAACGDDGGGLTEQPTLTLTTDDPVFRVVVGELDEITVTLDRGEFEGPVEIRVEGLPILVTAEPLILADDESTGTVRISAEENAAVEGPLAITVQAVAEGSLPGTLDTRLYVAGLPGSPDYSLGNRGVRYFGVTDRDRDYPQVVLQDSEGRFILGGLGTNIGVEPIPFVARVDANGNFDETFGDGGKVLGLINGYPDASVEAIVPDDSGGYRVLLFSKEGELASWVAALDDTGQLIGSYGTNGFANDIPASRGLVQVGQRTVAYDRDIAGALDPSGQPDPGFTLATLPNDFYTASESNGGLLLGLRGPDNFQIMRVTGDGAVDTSYGSDGAATWPNLPDNPAGTIISEIQKYSGGFIARGFAFDVETADAEYIPILISLDTDGVPVDSFGDSGFIRAIPPGNGVTRGTGFSGPTIVDSQGRIYAALLHDLPDGTSQPQVRRFMPDGTLDLSFGDEGKVNTDILVEALAVDEEAGRLTFFGDNSDTIAMGRVWL